MGADRVTVADDPAQRREAMVADWWQRFGEGEEALMIAKRNAEVRELNALARERMRAEGRLGTEEIEVGGARFAADDRIITRVNDGAAQIYNRQRWTVAEVDAASGRLVMDGIDTTRRVGVDSVFLGRVNPRDGAAAIEHAYAATIYQAQGATLEAAFVMADPSMTRQEFYVATSRSRGETHLYATPESQLAREEIAPRSPYLRGGLAHIAEAAERDGSQAAAHDEALRSRLGELPSPQLARLRDELRSESGREEARDERREALEQRIGESEARLQRFAVERAELGERPRRPREARRAYDERLRQIDSLESELREGVEELRAELRTLPALEHEARAELAVIEHVLAERQRLALAAARLSPPGYITRELGERPTDPVMAARWDRGVREIEGYRQEHGIRDRDNALGREPQKRERERLQSTQEGLGLRRTQERELSHDLGIGL